MPRVHYVKKARKDVKGSDIKKGESYYWWKFNFGAKHVSRTPPKQSQLTQSGFLATLYDIQDKIGDLTTADDFESAIEDIKSELESLKDETQDKLDNMPEQLQSAPTGEMLQNRIDELDSMISEFENIDCECNEESIAEEVKGNNGKEEDETKEDYEERIKEEIEQAIEEKKEEILQDIQGIEYNGE